MFLLDSEGICLELNGCLVGRFALGGFLTCQGVRG